MESFLYDRVKLVETQLVSPWGRGLWADVVAETCKYQGDEEYYHDDFPGGNGLPEGAFRTEGRICLNGQVQCTAYNSVTTLLQYSCTICC